MNRARLATAIALGAGLTVLAAGCGTQGIEVPNDRGAVLFAERCSGCHTLKAAGTRGSNGQNPTGPNLNNRKEAYDQALFAIRNGGFSGAIMPQNVVVGKDAEDVARFVAKYAGAEAKSPPSPNSPPAKPVGG